MKWEVDHSVIAQYMEGHIRCYPEACYCGGTSLQETRHCGGPALQRPVVEEARHCRGLSIKNTLFQEAHQARGFFF